MDDDRPDRAMSSKSSRVRNSSSGDNSRECTNGDRRVRKQMTKKRENGNQNLLDLIYPLQLFLAEKNAETDERLQGRTGCNESKL